MKYIILIVLLIPYAEATKINEIMYAPIDGYEYVEIYTNKNLSNCTIGDEIKNQTLTLKKLTNSEYQLIITPESPYIEINTTIYETNKIGAGLNNGGDTVYLYCNNTLIDKVQYYGTIANKNGKSLEHREDAWYEGYSPGKKNEETITESNQTHNETNEPTLEIKLPKEILAYYEYTTLLKITNNKPYPQTITWHYTIEQNQSTILKENKTREVNKWTTANTGKIKLEEEGNYTFCAWITKKECINITVKDTTKEPCNVSIYIENKQLLKQEKLEFNVKLTENIPFQATYWIENGYEETIRNEYTTNKQGKKQYTPKTKQTQALIIKTKLDFLACNTTGNKTTESLAVFIPKPQEPTLEIQKISMGKDNKVKKGEHITIKLLVNRGNREGTGLRIYATNKGKKITSTQLIKIEKQQEIQTTIPLQIKKGQGKAKITIEGYGLKKEANFQIEKEEIEETNIEEPKIASFYTRNKNYAKQITTYARLTKEANLELYEVKPLISIKSNGTTKIPTNITKENTTLLLIAKSEEKILDLKTLNLNLKRKPEPKPKIKEKPTKKPKAIQYQEPTKKQNNYLPWIIGATTLIGLITRAKL